MSHPAELLKKYLTELNNRITELEAKSDGGMQKVNAAISRLDEKLDSSVKATNQAIDKLCREKLSVQEFREFVDAFNRILSEILPLFERHAADKTTPAFMEVHAENASSFEGEAVAALPAESEALEDVEVASSSSQSVEAASQPIISIPVSEIGETAFTAQNLEEAALTPNVAIKEGMRKHIGFPMKTAGEVVYVEHGVTLVVGDVEIPPGTSVDETLVVKGNFKTRESCILMNNVKALRNIEIGDDTIVEGTLVSGGKVTVNPNCIVKGSIESEGEIEIGENVIVKKNLSSKSSIILSKSAQVLGIVNAAKGIIRS